MSSVAAQEPNCARNYTVQLGDTCDLISAANNVSTFQLAFVNADTVNADCSNLALGEPLCLGVTGQDCNITHVVASGDSCSSIDSAAGIPIDTLLANNKNVFSDCSNVYPGEVSTVSMTLMLSFLHRILI
ncbi:hypothetical protein DFH11DRAFT_1511170 [Phellopilus nigrolimitatus]|nr:hypothetical protein DFH11DRAFT_1511170 [Phellopilus nigrolimitatus]